MHYKYCFQENGQPCIKWRPVLVTVGGISTNLHVPFFFSFIFLFRSHFQPIGIKLQVLSTLRLRGVCLSSGIYTSTILLNVFKTPQRSFACLALESFFFLFVDTVAKYGKTNTTIRFISTFLQQFFNDIEYFSLERSSPGDTVFLFQPRVIPADARVFCSMLVLSNLRYSS